MNQSQRYKYFYAQGMKHAGVGTVGPMSYYGNAENAFQACTKWHQTKAMSKFGIQVMGRDFDAFFDGYKVVENLRKDVHTAVASAQALISDQLSRLPGNNIEVLKSGEATA